jgi:hypothetical protein
LRRKIPVDDLDTQVLPRASAADPVLPKMVDSLRIASEVDAEASRKTYQKIMPSQKPEIMAENRPLVLVTGATGYVGGLLIA